MNPSYFVGGHLDGKSHAMINNSNWFLTELDESDGSFLKVSQQIQSLQILNMIILITIKTKSS